MATIGSVFNTIQNSNKNMKSLKTENFCASMKSSVTSLKDAGCKT